MKYDIAFLSMLIPEQMEEEVSQKASKLMEGAAIAYQNHIIKGIEECNGGNVFLINVLPIRAYPQNYKDAFVKRREFSHKDGCTDINVGFCNVTILKRILQRRPIFEEVKKWASVDNCVSKVLITYTLYPEFLSSIKRIKKAHPEIIIISIVVDLPKLIASSQKNLSLLSKIYQEWSLYQSQKGIEFVDAFSVVTKQMGERISTSSPYVIIEGISTESFPDAKPKQDGKKRIIYAGLLFEKFGVLKLLEAFSNIKDQDINLILCGIGDAESEIIETAKKDDRIEFLGNLKREEVLKIMQGCDAIVNPRENVGEFTKYSFPSKNLEALSSGIPFVGYKLDGIPDEYDEYINYPEDTTTEALSKIIIDVVKDKAPEAKDKAAHARHWVLFEKNCKMQGKKILDLIEQIECSK